MKNNRPELTISFTFFASAAFFLSGELRINYIYALLFSFLHEVGHLIPMLIFKCRPKKISLGLFGIRIDKVDIFLTYLQECIVAVCGPFMNFLMMLIFSRDISTLPFIINTGLLCVNMLPVKSLDGGRFIYNLLRLICNGMIPDRVMCYLEIITFIIVLLILAMSLTVERINASFVLFSVMIALVIAGDIFEYKRS